MSNVLDFDFFRWKKTAHDLCYSTDMSFPQCIQNIMDKPWVFSGAWYNGDLWYQCSRVSDTQLQIIFTGGQFTGSVRTVYNIEFILNNNCTLALMGYQGEMFEGILKKVFNIQMPPMTPVDVIDRFMKQKINAKRINTLV